MQQIYFVFGILYTTTPKLITLCYSIVILFFMIFNSYTEYAVYKEMSDLERLIREEIDS